MKMIYYTEMTEDAFIKYVEEHSSTQRALFSKKQIAQMLHLAGLKQDAKKIYQNGINWASVDLRSYLKMYRDLNNK